MVFTNCDKYCSTLQRKFKIKKFKNKIQRDTLKDGLDTTLTGIFYYMAHKSGFVNIIGRPNVGKSTLMNTLVGERMSIITHKPQTTRHRIIGIVSDEHYQIVFSDTPGLIYEPNYKMQEMMNKFVHGTFEDGDLMILVTDIQEKYEADNPLFEKLRKSQIPKFLLINKHGLFDR